MRILGLRRMSMADKREQAAASAFQQAQALANGKAQPNPVPGAMPDTVRGTELKKVRVNPLRQCQRITPLRQEDRVLEAVQPHPIWPASLASCATFDEMREQAADGHRPSRTPVEPAQYTARSPGRAVRGLPPHPKNAAGKPHRCQPGELRHCDWTSTHPSTSHRNSIQHAPLRPTAQPSKAARQTLP